MTDSRVTMRTPYSATGRLWHCCALCPGASCQPLAVSLWYNSNACLKSKPHCSHTALPLSPGSVTTGKALPGFVGPDLFFFLNKLGLFSILSHFSPKPPHIKFSSYILRYLGCKRCQVNWMLGSWLFLFNGLVKQISQASIPYSSLFPP